MGIKTRLSELCLCCRATYWLLLIRSHGNPSSTTYFRPFSNILQISRRRNLNVDRMSKVACAWYTYGHWTSTVPCTVVVSKAFFSAGASSLNVIITRVILFKFNKIKCTQRNNIKFNKIKYSTLSYSWHRRCSP